MLEDYIKKIESLIAPNHYSKENFKEKLLTEGNKIPKDYGNLENNNKDILKDKNNNDLEDCLDNLDLTFKNKNNFGNFQIKTETFPSMKSSFKSNFKDLKETNIQRIDSPSKFKNENNEMNKNDEILIEDKNFNTESSISNVNNYTDKDINILLKKIHTLNTKNMSYRYDIEQFKKKILKLEEDLIEKDKQINQLDKQRENLSKYILRLENIKTNNKISSNQSPVKKNINNNINNINNINKQKNKQKNPKFNESENISKISQKPESMDINDSKSTFSICNINNINVDISNNHTITISDLSTEKSLILSSKQEQIKYLYKILNQNIKLKAFQDQVIELSKNYDDINENLFKSINDIQTIVETKGDQNSELSDKYQELVKSVQKTLEIKQNEYNSLLKVKDEQMEMINDELLELNSELEIRKKDRLQDLQKISELEQEINELRETIIEKDKDALNVNKNLKSLNQIKIAKNIEKENNKKIEPMKKMIDDIIKQMEQNFDLNDKENVQMIETIHKTLK